MATINLGRVKPVFRGAYSGATAYVVDDIVTYSNETYICILASTGNLPTDTTYWTKLAAKGTDGTDLTTTLTTQGDIVYRDVSGLQRLPIGTANQILQVNSGATALEYTAKPEGGLVHLATTDVSSATGYVSFQNIFTTDYEYYRINWSNMSNTSGGYSFVAYLTDNAGSQLGSGQYETVGGSVYGNSGVDGLSTGRDWATNYIKINSNASVSPSVACSGYIDISNPRDSANRTTYTSDHFFHDGTYHRRGFSGGCLANSVEVYGIEFSVTGGAINTNSVFSVYGFKKS
jgi:hypothetical protein